MPRMTDLLGKPKLQPMHRLGTRSLRVAIALALILSTGCGDKAPTEPSDLSLTGTWEGAFGRSPCLGDWTNIVMRLEQSGEVVSGVVETRDHQIFPIAGNVASGSGHLGVTIPTPGSECSSIGFQIMSVGQGGFSSQAQGRCCGTIMETVQFVRVAGA